jgi:hypothetical protein
MRYQTLTRAESRLKTPGLALFLTRYTDQEVEILSDRGAQGYLRVFFKHSPIASTVERDRIKPVNEVR